MLRLVQLGTRLRLSSGPSSVLSWDWLVARDSGFNLACLGLSSAHLARLDAWDRAEAWFGLEA